MLSGFFLKYSLNLLEKWGLEGILNSEQGLLGLLAHYSLGEKKNAENKQTITFVVYCLNPTQP